jgi:anaerobic selenocysteine-containing dehydrogenase
MHVLFRDGYADRAYMARYTDCPGELEAHVKPRTPAWASAITGLPVGEIEAFARLVGTTPRTFFRLGYGFARQRNGAVNMHAALCIPAVTGAWQHEGGGAFHTNGAIFHWDKTLIEGLDARKPGVRVLDQSRIGAVLTGEPKDLAGGPPVTALFIQNTNPVQVAPEQRVVKTGFLREDLFTCVHEQFMTETAALADIVLPATTFLEHDDCYTASGHTRLQVARKLIEPPEQARENHFVICELAKRLGARHPGFHMSAWELIDATLRRSGMWDAQTNYERGGQDFAGSFERMHFLDGFDTTDRRFHFRGDWKQFGGRWEAMPPLPDHLDVIDSATADKPFRLVTAPARTFLNSTFSETPSSVKRERRPTVLMHPQACTSLGIAEGERVRLGNERGEVVVHVEPREGQLPEVVVVEGIWPGGYYDNGIGINCLTSADPGWPNGGAVFHDTAVWIRPVRTPTS